MGKTLIKLHTHVYLSTFLLYQCRLVVLCHSLPIFPATFYRAPTGVTIAMLVVLLW